VFKRNPTNTHKKNIYEVFKRKKYGCLWPHVIDDCV